MGGPGGRAGGLRRVGRVRSRAELKGNVVPINPREGRDGEGDANGGQLGKAHVNVRRPVPIALHGAARASKGKRGGRGAIGRWESQDRRGGCRGDPN